MALGKAIASGATAAALTSKSDVVTAIDNILSTKYFLDE